MSADPGAGLSDRDLVERLTFAPADARELLDAELRRRLADPARAGAMRATLAAYANAAPEYVDERMQAVARRYLALGG